MVTILAHNITSPLGATSSENLDAVARGRTAVRQWRDSLGMPCAFTASLFGRSCFEEIAREGCSRLESLAISSARKAVAAAGVDVAAGRTLFMLSTTKGNVEWLADGAPPRVALADSASVIAKALGIASAPIVADTACISGLSAVITASRLLGMGLYDYAVVCGVEVQSKFIISGFQALKATSAEPCRPFDIDRKGLNLGEAAATLVLAAGACGTGHPWRVVNGCVRNDAFHLSAPSKTAEGATLALAGCMRGFPAEGIAFVNAHGTATLFNDQMESVAIARAGLGGLPVNGFKGNFGHTMGACGVLETVLSVCSVDSGVVLPTKGFSELGVSGKIEVADHLLTTRRQGFVKMLSGFGGGNAALLASRDADIAPASPRGGWGVRLAHHVQVTESRASADGRELVVRGHGKQLLTELYKAYVHDYPRFYKMDIQSRLGFIASELLLRAEGAPRFGETDRRAIVLAGRSGCLVADKSYLRTICDPADYYPSPERFVYTLPNIVTGEIAIRNHYHGETGFYLLEGKDDEAIRAICSSAFMDPATSSVLGGWIECGEEDAFVADLYIMERTPATAPRDTKLARR